MLLKPPDLAYVGNLSRRLTGVVIDDGSRDSLIDARLTAFARQEGFPSAPALIAKLQTSSPGDLHRRVAEAFLNNETWFFRHWEVFEAIRKVVLPDLIAKRPTERRLRIWSAGCASGQEPYSLSMLLREYFPVLATWDVRIFASDISNAMLARVREGRYSQLEVNRGLPAPFLVKSFEKKELGWTIKDDLRRPLELRQINLVEELPPLPLMDLILLRNVMIYFDVETRKKLLRRIRGVLKPDGFLFLGASETTLMLDDAYESQVCDKAVCYRIKGRVETR